MPVLYSTFCSKIVRKYWGVTQGYAHKGPLLSIKNEYLKKVDSAKILENFATNNYNFCYKLYNFGNSIIL